MAATFSNIFAELLDSGIEPVKAAKLAIEAVKANATVATTPAKAKTQKLAKSAKKQSVLETADPKKGEALLSTCKFKVEKTVRTDDGTTPVWRVTLVERIEKSAWADLHKYLSDEYYCSYWCGGWSFCFDPTTVLKGGKLSAQAKKKIEAKKAEVEAKKANKAEAKKATTAKSATKTTAKKARGKKSA